MREYGHTMTKPSDARAIPTDLDERTEAARAAFELPAIAVAITDEHGEIVQFAGAGSVAAEGPQKPPTPRTAWRVASITKPFTATSIFRLRDAGLLDLDDQLVVHLPEFAAARPFGGPVADVTLRRMLLHQSGLPTEAPLPSWAAGRFPSLEEILAAFPDTDVAIAPGEGFKYSNLAYGLLGEVVARRSGVPYVEYLRANILGPLDMPDSRFDPATPDPAAALADSWVTSRPLGGSHRPAPYASLNGIASAGQLITTAADLARWIAAQFPGGPAAHVLPDATLVEMQAATAVNSGPATSRTLGWELTTDLGGPVHGHGGGVFGFSSYVAFHVPSRTGVIVLANLWPSRGAAPGVAADLFADMLGGPRRAAPAAAPPPPPATEALPDVARPFLGAWFADPGFPVRLEWRAGGLHLLAADRGEYVLHAPTRLRVEGPDRLRALDGRGAGELLVFSDRAADGGWSRFEVGGFVYERT